jgi:hypothetical protein
MRESATNKTTLVLARESKLHPQHAPRTSNAKHDALAATNVNIAVL